MKHSLFVVIILLISFTSIVFSQSFNREIAYTGFLTDSSGNAVTGFRDITFSLYEGEFDNTPAWFETYTVEITDGEFVARLGTEDGKPLDLDFSIQYWLGVQVGNDPEMAPRQKLAVVPYAINVEVEKHPLFSSNPRVGTNTTGYSPKWDGTAHVKGLARWKIPGTRKGIWYLSDFNGTRPYSCHLDQAIKKTTGEGTLYIDTSDTISENLTVPERMSIVALKGNVLRVRPGYTLTFAGPFQGGLFQTFIPGQENGEVKFMPGTVRAVHPEWWADDSDDYHDAIEAAIDSLFVATARSENGTVEFQAREYPVKSTVEIEPRKLKDGENAKAKVGLRLIGVRSPWTSQYYDAFNFNHTAIRWNHPSNNEGPVFRILNSCNIIMENIEISGEGKADIGLEMEFQKGHFGGGCLLKRVIIKQCEVNNLHITGWGDKGLNRFEECQFRNGEDNGKENYKNDTDIALVKYDGIKNVNVKDVFSNCYFIHVDSPDYSVPPKIPPKAGSRAIFVETGSPTIEVHGGYTKTETGFSCGRGATPEFWINGLYSEDDDMFYMEYSINCRHVIENTRHVKANGDPVTNYSVYWAGSTNGGKPLVIRDSYLAAKVCVISNLDPIVIDNSRLGAGVTLPTEGNSQLLQIGSRIGYPLETSNMAVNGLAFVPALRQSPDTHLYVNLAMGTVFKHTLSTNSTIIKNPANVDESLDIGREIELIIIGDDSISYTITFEENSHYKLAENNYEHSGARKTDILRFRYVGNNNWLETSRSMGIDYY